MAVKIQIFITPTCPSCEPVFEETFRIIKEVKRMINEEIEIEKIDVTEKDNIKLALRYNIKTVPSIVICGKEVIKGVPAKETLVKTIQKCLR